MSVRIIPADDRTRTGVVYKIEAELLETTTWGHGRTWVTGRMTVTARCDDSDYSWTVLSNSALPAIGDLVTLTIDLPGDAHREAVGE